MKHRRTSNLGISRRRLLGGLGLGSAALLTPWVPLLSASGQEARRPKRLLLFFTPDGVAGGTDWKPQGGEADFVFHEVHAALQAHRADLVVPYGLKFSSAGAGEQHAYGMGGLWTGASVHEPHEGADFDGGNGNRTGWGSGPSVDQVVAAASGAETPYERALDDGEPETLFRTLEIGAMCGDPHIVSRMIYKADKQPIHPEDNPVAFFDRVFGQPIGLSPEELAQLRLEQRSVLDVTNEEINRLRPRLSAEERPKLDAHLEGLRAIERRLDAENLAVCDPPLRPADDGWHDEEEKFPLLCQTVTELAVRALACDATRVASIQLSRGFSGIHHTWAGVTEGGHHYLSHSTTENRVVERKVDAWYAEQFAALLALMKSIPEDGGTLLDNTLVLWGRELGNSSHSMSNAPLFLAGGARGALGTGRFLDYSGQPHAKLLVSVCRAMGLGEVTSFGNVDPESGALEGLLA